MKMLLGTVQSSNKLMADLREALEYNQERFDEGILSEEQEKGTKLSEEEVEDESCSRNTSIENDQEIEDKEEKNIERI